MTASLAADLHAAGVAANADMRPAMAARTLRTALRHLGPAARGALTGRILVSLALAESEQGHIAEGLRLLDEAEPLLPPQARGILYGQRGILLRRTGRDGPALDQYTAALAVLTEPVEIARVLLNRAVLHMAATRSVPARADLTRCAELAADHGFASLAAKAEHNLGYLDYLAGDLPRALHRYASVERAYAAGIPGMLAVLALDRSRALLAAGLFTEADRDLADAIAALGRQRLSQDHAEAHLARAEACLLAGRTAAASRWAARARTLFVRRDNPRWTARADLLRLRADQAGGARPATVGARATVLAAALATLGMAEDARVARMLAGRAHAAQGDLDRAKTVITGCRVRRGDRLDTRLLWRLSMAEVSAAAGEPRRVAARHLTAGLDDLARARAQLGSLDLQSGASVHGRQLVQAGLRAALQGGRPAEIFRWAERARAQALLMPPARPPADPAAAAALAELRQARTAIRAAELTGRAVGALRTRASVLERAIREHSWHATGSGPPGRSVSLATIRAGLGDAALVVYFADGPTLYALVATRERAIVAPLGRGDDATEALLRLRADLDAQAGRVMPTRLAAAVRDATRRDAGALGAAILDPIRPAIGDRDLVVVPTGNLVTVPWSVLPHCAGRPVTVAPSGTIWQATRRTMLHCGGPKRTLLVAGPGNQRGEPEVGTIAATLDDASVLRGAGATVDATLTAMADADLVHVAAHGHHHPDNALFSELSLADGPLMGYDLNRMTSTPAMVVLSSCDLGLHAIRAGDEALGMASALLSAGCATVVASVSRVADDTAMSLMVDFHRAMQRGARPATALARAGARHNTGFICFGAG